MSEVGQSSKRIIRLMLVDRMSRHSEARFSDLPYRQTAMQSSLSGRSISA